MRLAYTRDVIPTGSVLGKDGNRWATHRLGACRLNGIQVPRWFASLVWRIHVWWVTHGRRG